MSTLDNNNVVEKKPVKAWKRIRAGLMVALVGILLCTAAFGILSWNLPSVESLKNYQPPVASEIFSADFVKIGEFARERRIYVSLDRLPPLLVKAFVAAEDDQFFRHRGVSVSGIIRALFKNVQAGRVRQGGSTITQQVAKQLLLQSRERSYLRKARETILAIKMEKFLSKEEILEIYLNEVFLGSNSYGVEAAAQTFFGKDVANLSLAEIGAIAGLTKAPSRDNPHASVERARARQIYVLKRMLEEDYISKKEFEFSSQEPLHVAENRELNHRYAPYFVEHVRQYVMERYGDETVLTRGLQIYTTLRASSAEAAQRALREGIEEVDRHQGYRGPIQHLKEAERPALLEQLKKENADGLFRGGRRSRALITRVDDANGLAIADWGDGLGVIPIEDIRWARKPNPDRYWENNMIQKPSAALTIGDVVWLEPARDSKIRQGKLPKKTTLVSLAQEPTVQGALVALKPQTGEVEALVGGYDFTKSQFNRATQAHRQPGSAFKPIIYSAALDHEYTAAKMLVDSPIVYDDPTSDLTWKPKNFGGEFHGETVFRDCLIESRNIPTVKIVQDIGIDKVLEYAHRFGMHSPLARDFSLALGSSAVIPLELITAYSVLAAGGKRVQPVFVTKIVDREGHVLERNILDDPSLDLVEQAAVERRNFLSQVGAAEAAEKGKAPEQVLADGYAISPQTAFIMTHLLKQVIRSGTGQRASAINRPAAGKTGTTNDNRDAWFIGYTPTLLTGVWVGMDQTESLGAREEGGRAASPIWLSFMQSALERTPITDFSIPPGIVFAQIDPKTGKLATPQTKNPVYEAFKEGTEPTETTDQAQSRKSSQQFFLQE